MTPKVSVEESPTRETEDASDRKLCLLCGSADRVYWFRKRGIPIYRCLGCGLARWRPAGWRPDISASREETEPREPWPVPTPGEESPTEVEASRTYLEALRRLGASRERMLVIAKSGHPFVGLARAEGYEIAAAVTGGEFNDGASSQGGYATAVVLFELEGCQRPDTLLERVHHSLQADALLLVVTPSLDSWPAKFLREEWTEWRPEAFHFFDSQTIQSILVRSGFGEVVTRREHRRYSWSHLYARACAYPHTFVTRAIRWIHYLLPQTIRRRMWLAAPSSGIVVTARRIERRTLPLLSVVMPVYNERQTFENTMNAVLAKALPGLEKEIIVVESNSTDGTREAVLRYKHLSTVRVLLEERPRGKGRAVQTALAHARGDFVLIQDADEEYDVDDYDLLLRPLMSYQRAFVLGSRHMGDWKVRRFNAQPVLAAVYNAGHLVFVALLNLLYGQRLTDPFTMYKVFRRDCLHSLTFECNRFDFDFELVIKLLRKGYRPLEIPVNYTARPPSAGKKVSMLRDPLTWIRALIKYRFSRLSS